MILDLVLFAVGLVALYYGAEWLVGGAVRLATQFGVSPVVAGLTVVAFGTSAPELVVSGLASLRGSGDLAVGNVVGSNIANIALILGISALIRPMHVHRGLMVRDIPIMIGFAVLLQLGLWNGRLALWEGLGLLILFVLYMAHLIHDARKGGPDAEAYVAGEMALVEASPGKGKPRRGWDAMLVIVGTITLVVGAQLLVGSATRIARELGVSEVVIGLTLVAFGTSVPELAASVVASIRGEAQIVLGNIVGSNIFNSSLILGVAAIIRPLPVAPTVVQVEGPLMILLSLVLVPLARSAARLGRWEGGGLLASYLGFVAWVVMF